MARRFLVSFLVTGLLCACSTYRVRVIDTPETRGLKGWQKPYTVNGERYDPLLSHQDFVQDGLASWYGADAHGGPTSSGEAYDMHALTAAHKTLPLGVYVRVRATGRTAGRLSSGSTTGARSSRSGSPTSPMPRPGNWGSPIRGPRRSISKHLDTATPAMPAPIARRPATMPAAMPSRSPPSPTGRAPRGWPP